MAGVAGFRLNVWKLSLLGSGYVGKNLGPLLGALLQFPTTNDVNEWGLWGQFIFNITHHINASVLAGTSRPTESDIVAAGGGRVANSVFGGMVRYQDGGFAIGPEFYNVVAKSADKTGAETGLNVNQFLLSGMYFF